MDSLHFDDLIRALAGSRRSLLSGGLSLATGLLGIANTDARKKRKRKHKHKKKRTPTATPNEFGCLEVGDPCTSEAQCCSGICEGKKGNKTCRAHGTGTCDQDGPNFCTAATTLCYNSASCVCARTTAGSNFCGSGLLPSDCAVCQTDADCEALGFPAGSACVQWSSGFCAGFCESGMACIAPCGTPAPEA
jgi:hypothetical protein